jgi:hypothetical protein
VEIEPNDDFERELRQAFERRPAPPGLKRRLMEKRRARKGQLLYFPWQRLAAAFVLVAVLGAGAGLRYREERQKEEIAREQVLTALRITNHALNQVNVKLAAHHHAAQD